jgi:hypothetical protein
MARKQPSPPGGDQKAPHKQNPIERIAEEVEAHLIEGAELATSTTSAETNVVLAALGAIEGPQAEDQPKAEKKSDAGKKRKARPKAR